MVSLTHRAAERIRSERKIGRYIRLITENSSCSGMSYHIDFTDTVNNDDILYTCYGIKVLVDQNTRKYFEDLKVDYAGLNGNGKFTFETTQKMSA